MKDHFDESPASRLTEIVQNYGNLNELCQAYETLATLLHAANEQDVNAKQIASLMHYLNQHLRRCVQALQHVEALARYSECCDWELDIELDIDDL